MKDYYKILGVSRNASDASIRRAFRCRAKLLHPDINPAKLSTRDFQRVNEAYQVLKNAEKRRLYDMRLMHGSLGQKVYYRPGQNTASHHAPNYSQMHVNDYQETYNPTRFEKAFDKFLFFFMLMLGFSALFYGIYRALGEPVEGVNPYLGIIFGVVFTSLFIFGWDRLQRIRS